MTTAFKFNPFTGNFDIVTTQVDLSTSDVTGILPEANGGTHQSTYTTGDTLYASASNTLSKLPVGSNGNFLTVAAGIPAWTAVVPGSPNYQVSSSCGNFSTASASYTDVTNLSVTITTSGNPVRLMLVPDGSGTVATITAQNTTAGQNAIVDISFNRAGSTISENQFAWQSTGVTILALNYAVGVSTHAYFDPVSAGTYTYKVQIRTTGGAGTSVQLNNAKLVAYEI